MFKNKYRVYRTVLVIILLATLIAAYIFSSQTKSESHKVSKVFSDILNRIFAKDYFIIGNPKGVHITVSNGEFVRKTAHSIIFGSIALFVYLFVATFPNISLIYRSTIAFLFSVICAAADELHQFFVPGRGCRVANLFNDSLSAFTVIGLITFITYIFLNYREKESEENE